MPAEYPILRNHNCANEALHSSQTLFRRNSQISASLSNLSVDMSAFFAIICLMTTLATSVASAISASAASAISLRENDVKLLVTTSSYYQSTTYSDSACTSVFLGSAYRLDYCLPAVSVATGAYSLMYTSSGSDVTLTTYSDTACATGPVATPINLYSTCTFFGGSFYDKKSITTSPSFGSSTSGITMR